MPLNAALPAGPKDDLDGAELPKLKTLAGLAGLDPRWQKSTDRQALVQELRKKRGTL